MTKIKLKTTLTGVRGSNHLFIYITKQTKKSLYNIAINWKDKSKPLRIYKILDLCLSNHRVAFDAVKQFLLFLHPFLYQYFRFCHRFVSRK